MLDAGRWLKHHRTRLGWTPEELCKRTAEHVEVLGVETPGPTPQAVIELEAGEPATPPRWLRWAHCAFEHADRAGRVEPCRHPFEARQMLVFDDEYRMLQHLAAHPDDRRQKIQSFIGAWAGPFVLDRFAALEALLIALDLDQEFAKLHARLGALETTTTRH